MGIMDLFKKIEIFKKQKTLKAPWAKHYGDDGIEIKIPNITMYEQILESSMKYPDLYAYQYYGTKKKFSYFIKQIDKAAIALREMGVKKGDIICIIMPNTPEALITLYGANKLGAVCNMIHPLSSETDIKNYLNETNSTHLLMIDLVYEKVKNIIDETSVKYVICCCASNSMPLYMKIGYFFTKRREYKNPKYDKTFISYRKFMRKANFKEPVEKYKHGKDVPAIILHSGGTTGKPKAIVLANSNFNALVEQSKIYFKRLKSGDTCLAIMPIFHGFGLSVSIHTAYAIGANTVLVPTFDSRKFDELINKYKPSILLGVPTLYEALINSNNVKDLDLSCLKYIISGGDNLNANLEAKINKYLEEHNCSVQISQGYGMTEAMAAVATGCKEWNRPGSFGIPFPGNYIQIIDPATGKEVKPGKSGEICICGPTVMLGYLDNEKETQEMLRLHKDGHVWLHTGDLGRMDEDGFFYYEQRLKRMIISSGYNVYPQHVEEIIEQHEAVLTCTVVGVPHPYKMEVPKAFVVLKDGYHGSIFTKKSIKDHCKKNLAHYAIPHDIVFRKSLPKTLLGKVDFKALQKDNDPDDDI